MESAREDNDDDGGDLLVVVGDTKQWLVKREWGKENTLGLNLQTDGFGWGNSEQ